MGTKISSHLLRKIVVQYFWSFCCIKFHLNAQSDLMLWITEKKTYTPNFYPVKKLKSNGKNDLWGDRDLKGVESDQYIKLSC